MLIVQRDLHWHSINLVQYQTETDKQIEQLQLQEARIRAIEVGLAALPPRIYLPKERIAAVADSIHDGDLIAATSTVAGLDVAHTGFAIRQHGRLLLLHAPLVGKSVEISALPLAERIQAIKTQDGIMVARPAP